MMTSHLLVVFIYRVRHSSSLATPVDCHGNVHILSITCVYMIHNASLITGYVTADGVHNQENMRSSPDPFSRVWSDPSPSERVWSGGDTITDTTYHDTTNYVCTCTQY